MIELLALTAALAVAGQPSAPAPLPNTAPAHGVHLLVQTAQKGTLVGKIKLDDGSPAADFPVYLYKMTFESGSSGGAGDSPKPQSSGIFGHGDATGLMAEPDDGTSKRFGKPLSVTKTDKDGAFKIPRPLDAGTYRIVVGSTKTAYAARSVSITAGKETTFEATLTPDKSAKKPEPGKDDKGNDEGRRR